MNVYILTVYSSVSNRVGTINAGRIRKSQ